jgi:hypothetical protein
MANRTKKVTLRLDEKSYSEMMKAARWLDCSLSQAIRAAIRRYLKGNGNEWSKP